MQQKLVEIKTQMCEKDRYNHTLETFVRRHKDVLQTFDKLVDEFLLHIFTSFSLFDYLISLQSDIMSYLVSIL